VGALHRGFPISVEDMEGFGRRGGPAGYVVHEQGRCKAGGGEVIPFRKMIHSSVF